MSGSDSLKALKKQLPGAIIGEDLDAVDPWIEVAPNRLVEVGRALKSDSRFLLDMLNCITAVDYFHSDPAKAKKADWEPHLEIVYHLSSIAKKHTLVLKVKLPRWRDDVPGQIPQLDSVSGIWATANWHEREVFDLSGVDFVGHPDLRRILCPEDWVGYPLRKDYEMPLEYHGIRGR